MLREWVHKTTFGFSKIAASAVYLARRVCDFDAATWDAHLSKRVKYTREQLMDCVITMAKVVKAYEELGGEPRGARALYGIGERSVDVRGSVGKVAPMLASETL